MDIVLLLSLSLAILFPVFLAIAGGRKLDDKRRSLKPTSKTKQHIQGRHIIHLHRQEWLLTPERTLPPSWQPDHERQISTTQVAGFPLVRDWQRRRIQNSTTPIGRLPVELLLMIMKEVEKNPIDLYILRQTCHLFASLFGDGSFSSFHEDPELSLPKLPLVPWKFYDEFESLENRYMPFGPNGQEDLFRRLFWADLCTKCRQMRASGECKRRLKKLRFPNLLNCNGCQGDHSAIMCSAGQRALSSRPRDPEGRRVCIVHEGSIKLCSHYSVRYSQIREWAAITAQGASRGFMECQECFTNLESSALSLSTFREGTYQARLVIFECLRTFDVKFKRQKLLKTWELPIFRVSDEDNEITHDGVVRGLEDAQVRYSDLPCSHLRFNDGRLLREFSCRDSSCLQNILARKAGKRGPTHADLKPALQAFQAICPLHEHHEGCVCEWPWAERQLCAFKYRFKWSHQEGKFRKMASNNKARGSLSKAVLGWPYHRVWCELCNAEYTWIRRGNEFWISFRQKLDVRKDCVVPYASELQHEDEGFFIDAVNLPRTSTNRMPCSDMSLGVLTSRVVTRSAGPSVTLWHDGRLHLYGSLHAAFRGYDV